MRWQRSTLGSLPPALKTVHELASDLRLIDARTGEVLDTLEMPSGIGVSRLESDGGQRFFCGGGQSGKIRVVRRPA